MWGVTCPNTYAPSHLALAGVEAGSVATEAEYIPQEDKISRVGLYFVNLFVSLDTETSGDFGPAVAAILFTDLGKQVAEQKKEPRAFSFLLQSVAVKVHGTHIADIVFDYLHCFIYLSVVVFLSLLLL